MDSTRQLQGRDDAAMKAEAEREDRRKAEAANRAPLVDAPAADAPKGPSDTMPPLTPVGEKRLLELQAMDGLSRDQQMELDRLLGRVYDAPAESDAPTINTARAMTPIEVARLKALQMMNVRTVDENGELERLHEMAAFSAGETKTPAPAMPRPAVPPRA